MEGVAAAGLIRSGSGPLSLPRQYEEEVAICLSVCLEMVSPVLITRFS
uniref:Uncharacterized protein n=1 Tax=Thermogemmatispora argillosa TaxID=2045280 RepID=A0A455T7N4_9CHLR|nr:hypothetical protein KTA_36570 [Thermogemmatispora argillosa]